MSIKKIVLSFLLLILLKITFANELIPELFQLKWGSGFEKVQNEINKKNIGLGKLKYYSIIEGRDESFELRNSFSIKYNSNGSPFFNIPSNVHFTFYNPTGKKEDLKLAKIEVFLNKKDKEDLWVDYKATFKKFLKLFFEIYELKLDYTLERQIYTNFEYKVTLNDIYVHFIANSGNNALYNDTSVYLSYESNKYQNLILKAQKEILENDNMKDKVYDETEIIENTKKNL